MTDLRGKPLWKRCDEDVRYYWLDGKQGYPTGDVWARTSQGARREIRARHGGTHRTIDRIMHYDDYHNVNPMPLVGRRQREETP